MDEYRKIWKKVDANPDEGFVFSDEIWKKYYTTSKILNNTFRSIVEFCSEGDSSGETVQAAKRAQNLRQLCIVYKKKIKWKNPTERRYLNVLHPVAKCPEKSLLDAVQHEVYCYLYDKLTHSNARYPLTKEENSLFSTLHQQVLQERPMFYKYVENIWPTHQKRCKNIHPEIKKYVDTVWKIRLSSVNTYPQKYCNVKMVPLVFSGNSKLVRALPAPKDSFSSGIAARYIPPNYGMELKVNTDNDEMAAVFPPESFATKTPVSRDKTAQNIVSGCGPDVVISMSGLKCIMDNFSPEYDTEWDIPVVVREEKSSNGSYFSKKVVYIDKPLPPRSMSIMDKNKWYHKYGIRALLCRPRSQGVLKPTVTASVGSKSASPTKSAQNTSAEKAENELQSKSPELICKKDGAESENENDEKLLESSEEDDQCPSDSSTERLFIACSDDDSTREHHTQKKKKVTRQSVPKLNRTRNPEERRKSQCSDRSEIESCDNKTCDNKNASASVNKNASASVQKQIKTYGKQSKHNMLNVSATASSAAHELEKSSPSTNGNISEEEKHTSEDHSKRTNLMLNFSVSYRLWKLMLEKDSQEETRANFLKSESGYRPIVMLVRSKQDSVRIANGEVHPVCLASKLEYQSEYGMELPAMSEVCRQWISLYFRDKCNLVRARIDAPSQKLLLVEDKKMEDLAREWFDQRIRSSLLSILYSILLGLLDVEPGNYLLSHRKKMGAFASLMKATDRDSSLDLKQMYESVDAEAPEIVTEIQWPPLDVNLQTPNQYKLHRVPCLFEPCTISHNTTYKTQNKFKPNKKKKKKKKKPIQEKNKHSEGQTSHTIQCC
ncbi:little elongation complex subunit 2-like isoform X1 [Schistocerca piceifrons]|uniref:little elongation complex subunit 2-like isoform X1 n=1 Tax=Schistocerca piceifrons TaxID=274613 RepID=UPI001F5EB42B|nr:little elongation complex subunit 2-like isoform X1 [Schistocerca piceifrons]